MTIPSRAGRRRRLTRHGQEIATGFVFVAPVVLGSLAFVIGPLFAVVWYSFHDWNVLASRFTFVGIDNYRAMAGDAQLSNALVVSLWFCLGVVVLNLSISLFLAVMLNQRLPGTTFFRVAFFSPVVVSLVAWTIVWSFLLQNDGGINGLLAVLGITGPNWLRGETTALIAVVVVQVFKNLGLNMILFLSALQEVPEDIQEAARLDGAGPWRRFRSIALPMISPMILLVSILTVAGSLETFALIDVMTAGGPGDSTTVLVYYLYRQAFQFNQFGYASAIAVLLFVIVLVLTILQWWSRKRWVFHES